MANLTLLRFLDIIFLVDSFNVAKLNIIKKNWKKNAKLF